MVLVVTPRTQIRYPFLLTPPTSNPRDGAWFGAVIEQLPGISSIGSGPPNRSYWRPGRRQAPAVEQHTHNAKKGHGRLGGFCVRTARTLRGTCEIAASAAGLSSHARCIHTCTHTRLWPNSVDNWSASAGRRVDAAAKQTHLAVGAWRHAPEAATSFADVGQPFAWRSASDAVALLRSVVRGPPTSCRAMFSGIAAILCETSLLRLGLNKYEWVCQVESGRADPRLF